MPNRPAHRYRVVRPQPTTRRCSCPRLGFDVRHPILPVGCPRRAQPLPAPRHLAFAPGAKLLECKRRLPSEVGLAFFVALGDFVYAPAIQPNLGCA